MKSKYFDWSALKIMRKYLVLLTLFILCACQAQEERLNGYIEGEFVRISPTSGGVLKTLSVKRGQNIQTGEALFSLDVTELTAQRDSAQFNLERARAELDNLIKGERPEDIKIILKQKEQAQATLTNTRLEYNRILSLSKGGVATLSARDNAKADLDKAKAKIEELNAQINAANLGARIDEINAKKASIEVAAKVLEQAEKKLKDAAPRALGAAFVEDTYFLPGEYVAAGQPVVNLLPPENVKIRFFVSQEQVPQLQYGQDITVTCDGCAGAIAAKISYIAPQTEYTPPVIFSVESREKLVFLIEAKPKEYQEELRPGLPVNIDLGK